MSPLPECADPREVPRGDHWTTGRSSCLSLGIEGWFAAVSCSSSLSSHSPPLSGERGSVLKGGSLERVSYSRTLVVPEEALDWPLYPSLFASFQRDVCHLHDRA